MTWEQMMEKVEEKKEFKTVVLSAKHVLLGVSPAPPKNEGVELQTCQGVVVEKSFICLTEREMKKECNLARIPKSAVRGCNTIQIPTPDGKGKETGYLFVDGAEPYRKCKVTLSLGSTLRKEGLSKENFLWKGQGQEFHVMCLNELGEESYAALAARDMNGHLMSSTWQDFKQTKLLAGKGEEEDDEENMCELDEGHSLVGVAAVAAAENPVSTGKKGKKKDTFQSPPEKVSVMRRLFSTESMSVAGSAADDGANQAETAGSEGPSRASEGLGDEDLPGPDVNNRPLCICQKRIELKKCMDGSIDRRTTNGLVQAINRCTCEDTQDVLRTFQRLVKACLAVSPENFKQLKDSEIKENLDIIEDNGEPLLPAVQHSLILRHINKLLAERRYVELMEVLNPWKTEVFNTKKPCLAGLPPDDGERRIGTFKKTMFTDIFSKLVKAGDTEATTVRDLCVLCIKEFGSTDLLDADTVTASCHTSSMHIWRGLRALVMPCMDVSLQDMGKTCHALVYRTILRMTVACCFISKQCRSSIVLSWSVPVVQDDVKKLKASIGQARATILTTIGQALQSSSYYMRLLEEYLEKCPAQIEYEPKVKSYEEVVQKVLSTSATAASISELKPLAHTLPTLVHALRTGCLTQLLDGFRQCLSHLWLVTETEILFTTKQTQDLNELMHLALVLWPQDPQLQKFTEAAGQMLQRCGQENLAQDMLQVLNGVKKADINDTEAFSKAVEQFNEKALSTEVDLQVYSGENHESGFGLVTHVLDFLDKHKQADKPFGAVFEGIQVCIEHVAARFSNPEVQRVADALKAGQACAIAYADLKGAETDDNKDVGIADVSTLIVLKRRLESFTSAIVEPVPEAFKHNTMDWFKQVHDKLKSKFELLQKNSLDMAAKKVDSTFADLETIASGLPGKGDWLQAAPSDDWSKFLEHAQNTILKQSGVNLFKAENALQEAPVRINTSSLVPCEMGPSFWVMFLE
eukprot:6488871-Amphidinium_carterae.2